MIAFSDEETLTAMECEIDSPQKGEGADLAAAVATAVAEAVEIELPSSSVNSELKESDPEPQRPVVLSSIPFRKDREFFSSCLNSIGVKRVFEFDIFFLPEPFPMAFLPILNSNPSRKAMMNVWPTFPKGAHKLITSNPTTQVVTKTYQFYRFPVVDNLFLAEFSQSGYAPMTSDFKISLLAMIDDSISFACDFYRIVHDEIWLFNVTVPSRICIFGENDFRAYFKFSGGGKNSKAMVPFSDRQTRFQFKMLFEGSTEFVVHELLNPKICVNIVLDHFMKEDVWHCNLNLLPV